MNYKTIKKMMNIFRGILLAITVVALAVFALWLYDKPLVDKIERGLVYSYKAYYQADLEQCKKLLDVDEGEGIECIESFLEGIDEIKKKDRLDPLKRQAYGKVVSSLRSKGDNASALEWANRWVAFDERDLYALVQQATTMMVHPDFKEEGRAKLDALYQKVPDAKVVAENYATTLLDNGEYAEAFLVIDNYINTSGSFSKKDWELFWDTGKSFNAGQRISLRPDFSVDGAMRLSFQLQPGVSRIRIDPPPSMSLLIANPQIKKIGQGSNIQINISELPLHLNQILKKGEKLQTTGDDDPYFFWSMPTALVSDQKTTWAFTADVKKGLPVGFKKLLTPDVAERIKSELLDRSDSGALYRFNLAIEQQSALKQTPIETVTISQKTKGFIELFWKAADKSFAQMRKKRLQLVKDAGSDTFYFSHYFPINAVASQLRIDFPDILDVNYQLDLLEIVNIAGSAYDYPVESMVPSNLHNVIKAGRIFRVVGKDPYFSFDVPDDFGAVNTLGLKGAGR